MFVDNNERQSVNNLGSLLYFYTICTVSQKFCTKTLHTSQTHSSGKNAPLCYFLARFGLPGPPEGAAAPVPLDSGTSTVPLGPLAVSAPLARLDCAPSVSKLVETEAEAALEVVAGDSSRERSEYVTMPLPAFFGENGDRSNPDPGPGPEPEPEPGFLFPA